MKTVLIRLLALSVIVCFLLSCSNSDETFSEEKIVFINYNDHTKLAGTITYPESLKSTAPAVVLIHGSGPCDRDLDIVSGTGMFRELAHYLASKGIIVLRYDKRGVGESGGSFVSYDIDNFADDGIAAVKFLETIPRVQKDGIGVIGLSQGGIVAPLMQLEYPAIKFLVLMGSPGTWGKEFFFRSHLALAGISDSTSAGYKKNRILMNELWPILTGEVNSLRAQERGKEILAEMWSYVNNIERRTLGYTGINMDMWIDEFTKPGIRKWYGYNQQKTLSELNCPVLAITGNKDVQAPPGYNLPKIKDALEIGGNSEFKVVELDHVNHLFQNCVTGMPSEYSRIGNDFSEQGFENISLWIKEQSSDQ